MGIGGVDTLEEGIELAKEHWQQMFDQVQAAVPEEACGLLGGENGSSRLVIPVPNSLHSPVRFRMEPRDQLKALQLLEREGLDLLGIYHSHPNGPAHPSPTDVAEVAFPEAANIIWAPIQGVWSCRAFRINSGIVKELLIELVNV